jgi:hypothetical protein
LGGEAYSSSQWNIGYGRFPDIPCAGAEGPVFRQKQKFKRGIRGKAELRV